MDHGRRDWIGTTILRPGCPAVDPIGLMMNDIDAEENEMSGHDAQCLIETPIGWLGLHWRGDVLTGIDLDPPPDDHEPQSGCEPPRAITRQLDAYFRAPETHFDLPLELTGTAFQQRVWALLRTIPVGQTRTYGEIARELGSAARAVGQACRANPCPIVVPCHRVVGQRGLGGFAGDRTGRRLTIKRRLLEHEGVLRYSASIDSTLGPTPAP